MKKVFLVCSIFIFNNSFAQCNDLNLSFTLGNLQNGIYSNNLKSNIVRTSQLGFSVDYSNSFKNRKFFGYSLGLQTRLESYKVSLNFKEDDQIDQLINFNKVSFNPNWGLRWRFPIWTNHFYLISGFNLGVRYYTTPDRRFMKLDSFNSDTNQFQYIVDMKNESHLNINGSLFARVSYLVNEKWMVFAGVSLNSTEKILYKILIEPITNSYTVYSNVSVLLEQEHYQITEVRNFDFSLGVSLNLGK